MSWELLRCRVDVTQSVLQQTTVWSAERKLYECISLGRLPWMNVESLWAWLEQRPKIWNGSTPDGFRTTTAMSDHFKLGGNACVLGLSLKVGSQVELDGRWGFVGWSPTT